MIQNTVLRLNNVEDVSTPLVVCNEEHRFMIAEQLQEIEENSSIILEPVGRNTAPAVAVAALKAREQEEDPILLVLPADHVIRDENAFCKAVTVGAEYAEQGNLITFGIVPDAPETGFGYIRKQEKAALDNSAAKTGMEAYPVDSFVEKPDLATAREYIASGDYYWNSGMFMFQASRYLDELKKFAPAMLQSSSEAYARKTADLDFIRLDADTFSQCPSDSIDYAVMEKTSKCVVVPLDCGWSDVGSWSALWEIGKQDTKGNVLSGNMMTHDVQNCYIHATHRMVAAVGLEDHIVVETADAVLVAHKDKAQDVKKIVESLKVNKLDEANCHRRVFRPWGSYECVDSAERFQVKRIIVKPGAMLSAQMHYHRAEHWIVVKGTAKVVNGEETIILSENESTYIPLGTHHRLENPGTIPLELIEVQSGSYLGEDDIVRFEDVYGRSGNNISDST